MLAVIYICLSLAFVQFIANSRTEWRLTTYKISYVTVSLHKCYAAGNNLGAKVGSSRGMHQANYAVASLLTQQTNIARKPASVRHPISDIFFTYDDM